MLNRNIALHEPEPDDKEELLVENMPGLGIHLRVSTIGIDDGYNRQDTSVLIGNEEHMNTFEVEISEVMKSRVRDMRGCGRTVVFMAVNRRIRAIIGMSDTVRQEAADLVHRLHASGYDCYIVSGDNQSTVESVAGDIGIPRDKVIAGAKPEDKKNFILSLQERGLQVAFVGDGTNDCPALSQADVGFAMAGGTDIAVDAGDMILCGGKIMSLLVGLHLSRVTMRRIIANYFWAIVYNIVLIPVASGVLYPVTRSVLDPMLAGAAMAISSLSIVTSSLLLLRYQPPRHSVTEAHTSLGRKKNDLITIIMKCLFGHGKAYIDKILKDNISLEEKVSEERDVDNKELSGDESEDKDDASNHGSSSSSSIDGWDKDTKKLCSCPPSTGDYSHILQRKPVKHSLDLRVLRLKHISISSSNIKGGVRLGCSCGCYNCRCDARCCCSGRYSRKI